MTSRTSSPTPRVAPRNLKITVADTKRVVPSASISEVSPVTLTGQDLSMAKIYMHMHYLFAPSASLSLSEIGSEVEQALASTLAHFPLVAGSIEQSDGGYELRDSRKGVELQFANAAESAGGLTPEEIGGSWDQDVGTRSPFVGEEEALMALRLTRYTCGTFSLTTSVHHWLMDFASYFDFLSAFAAELSGLGSYVPTKKFDFSRNVFDLLEPSGEAPAEVKNREEDDAEVRYWFRSSAAPPCFKRPVNHTHVVPVLFKSDKLAELKGALVKATGEAAPMFSTMDALHALLWSTITRSREVAPLSPTKLLVTMDGRRRVANSELAERYFGNVHPGFAFRLDAATSTPSHEALAQTAQKLRSEYLAKIGPSTMERIVRYQQRNMDRVSTNIDAMFANDVVISNLSGYEYCGVEFGRLGKPKAVTMLGSKGVEYGPYRINAADGTVTVLAAPLQDGASGKRPDVIAYIGVREQEMVKLLEDEELKTWGQILY